MSDWNWGETDETMPPIDSLSANQRGIVSDVKLAHEMLRKFKNVWRKLARDEELEKTIAEDLLRDAQRRCYHSWKVMHLFTSVERRCMYCDVKDESYDYVRKR